MLGKLPVLEFLVLRAGMLEEKLCKPFRKNGTASVETKRTGERERGGRVVAEETHRELPRGAKIRENHARISLVFRPL